MEKQLRAAIDALGKGQDEVALAELLAAWRKKKVPALADRIDKVSARITRPPVKATKSMQAGWLARAATADPADIDAILAALGDARKVELAARLEARAALPPDPRVTQKLVALLRDPPITGPSGRGVSGQMLDLLVASGDPRAAAALVAAEPKGLVRLRRLGRFVQGRLSQTLPVLAAMKAPQLPAAVEPLIEELDAALASKKAATKKVARDGAELLAAVHAAPEDDAARLVYADFLLEAGDPRGELIVLQCERARTGGKPSKRETELLKTYARAWLGPLDKVLLKKGIVYERGFLAECSYASTRVSDDALGQPLWSTVTAVDLGSARMDAPGILSHAVCGRVRKITGVVQSEFFRIQNRSLEHVGIRFFRLDDELAEALARHPNLRRIDVDHGPLDGLRALADARLPSVRILSVLGRRGPMEQLTRDEDGGWVDQPARSTG